VQGVAIADRAYQHAVYYARERVQGRAAGDRETGAIIRHADVRRMLLTMRALTEAARAINYVAFAQCDVAAHSDQAAAGAKRVELLTPIAKGWATEIAQEVTSLGLQVHGGMGYIEETGAAQFVRDARIVSIYEGTTGIQANDLIGRKLIRDNGAEMTALIAEMRATEQQLQASGGEWQTMAAALRAGLDQLEQTVAWVLANHASDERLAAAAAFNLLMLAGTVVGGEMMSRAAWLAQSQADADFAKAKFTVAQFYAEQIMPRAAAYASATQSGSETLMAMSDEAF
jgi:hypothetical protein